MALGEQHSTNFDPPASMSSNSRLVEGQENEAEQLGAPYSSSNLQKEESSGAPSPEHPGRQTNRSKKWLFLAIIVVVVIVIFLVVFLPVYFVVVRKPSRTTEPSSSTTRPIVEAQTTAAEPATPTSTEPVRTTTGGDGSVVTTENGTTFVYNNPFGGFWVHDPKDPFNNNARPNSWTPPLNTTWRWGVDRIYGVNLGGLFVLEPFITPSLFQRYPGTMDEYSLSIAMAADQANGGLNQLENHYNTFITEMDIAEIAGAGLNWIRVPLGFWAIETWAGEPFLAKTSWTYFLRVIEWARKYGLRVVLDLHAVPGSQNGLNHSGKFGTVNFLAGNMGIANAERTLDYLRILTEYISQPQYRDVFQVIQLVNEPMAGQIGLATLNSFNLRAYNILRRVTGFGAGNGPYIAIQDGLQPLTRWFNMLPGADRIVMDGHAYFAFGGDNLSPMAALADDGRPGGTWPSQACRVWGPLYNRSRSNIGPTFCGEFSAAPNDCGLFIRTPAYRSANPQCPEYNNWENYNSTMKAGLRSWVMASFDAFGDFFFWTWKIGPSIAGRVEAPLWSYKLGLDNGWIPKDPRTSVGKCAALGASSSDFDGEFEPYRTGAVPSPTVPASYAAQYPWPPVSISSADVPVNLLPTYTNTGPIPTLPVPTFTEAPQEAVGELDGWFNNADTTGAAVPVAGCFYPNRYTATFAVLPTARCAGA